MKKNSNAKFRWVGSGQRWSKSSSIFKGIVIQGNGCENLNKYVVNNAMKLITASLLTYEEIKIPYLHSGISIKWWYEEKLHTGRGMESYKLVSRNAWIAKPAAQTSSSNTCSSGEWLIPPRHLTNSIPTYPTKTDRPNPITSDLYFFFFFPLIMKWRTRLGWCQ